jgi:hypothetical protein
MPSNKNFSNKKEEKGLREACLLCVSKHIAQAIVLTMEAGKGYPLHLWFGVGHLAEAEDEALQEFPQLSNAIRSVRLCLMGQQQFEPKDLIDLLIHTRAVCAGINGYTENYRTAEILAGRRLTENDTIN